MKVIYIRVYFLIHRFFVAEREGIVAKISSVASDSACYLRS